MVPEPKIGDIVYYVYARGLPNGVRAAIVTGVLHSTQINVQIIFDGPHDVTRWGPNDDGYRVGLFYGVSMGNWCHREEIS